MYTIFEQKLRELLENATHKDQEEINDLLQLLVENIKASEDIIQIKKYLQSRLNKKRRVLEDDDMSFVEVRNHLMHKGRTGESRVNIFKYEDLIWKILPRIRSFNDSMAVRNLLAYVMNRSISGENEFVQKETIVKEYRQLYRILPKRQKELILFELARRIFAEVTRLELEVLIHETKYNLYKPGRK